ncbi:hypothetical protein [Nibricoccus sp. IMCC34717]|uniref:hypothetical protein n=1 Tax=Nibricoccus sp. IMCC34717 TaxID=3034021 RepID=UPI003850D9C8
MKTQKSSSKAKSLVSSKKRSAKTNNPLLVALSFQVIGSLDGLDSNFPHVSTIGQSEPVELAKEWKRLVEAGEAKPENFSKLEWDATNAAAAEIIRQSMHESERLVAIPASIARRLAESELAGLDGLANVEESATPAEAVRHVLTRNAFGSDEGSALEYAVNYATVMNALGECETIPDPVLTLAEIKAADYRKVKIGKKTVTITPNIEHLLSMRDSNRDEVSVLKDALAHLSDEADWELAVWNAVFPDGVPIGEPRTRTQPTKVSIPAVTADILAAYEEGILRGMTLHPRAALPDLIREVITTHFDEGNADELASAIQSARTLIHLKTALGEAEGLPDPDEVLKELKAERKQLATA